MRSDSSLRAVSTITPSSFVSSRPRSSVSTSYPDAPGSIRSRTTRSGRSSRAARSASRPLAAVVTRYPSFARWYATSAVMSGSSSTTRMRWLAGLLTAQQVAQPSRAWQFSAHYVRGRGDAVIRVFVNERPVSVAPGARVREAVEQLDQDLAELVGRGAAYVTAGVGRPVGVGGPVGEAGGVCRVGGG